MTPTRSAAACLVLLLAGTTTNAFSPVAKTTPVASATSTTSLRFGFLKELGLEKPSWLPDFGGKKGEEVPAPAAVEAEDADAPADEAADTPEE
ncbi:unnamed protein product [Pseudo-nitzschia multistriata]|uniref:RxLR effector protein n=1 Tax=Pseudo-nitzschia multistriata TaxID=183589 RepID=A0A448YZ82_9STRA|nr:unnamed protein product [Pseudo-nitzschia multistriata]